MFFHEKALPTGVARILAFPQMDANADVDGFMRAWREYGTGFDLVYAKPITKNWSQLTKIVLSNLTALMAADKIAWRFKNFQIIMKLLPMRNSDVDLNSLRLAMNVLATLVKKSKKAQPG